jgi:hypothetical protein
VAPIKVSRVGGKAARRTGDGEVLHDYINLQYPNDPAAEVTILLLFLTLRTDGKLRAK